MQRGQFHCLAADELLLLRCESLEPLRSERGQNENRPLWRLCLLPPAVDMPPLRACPITQASLRGHYLERVADLLNGRRPSNGELLQACAFVQRELLRLSQLRQRDDAA